MCAKSVIAESNHYIVLDEYTEYREGNTAYQTEADLEREFVADLKKQGYEYLNLKSQADLLGNLRRQLEAFNNVVFSDAEWERLLTEYLDNPSDTLIEKTEKLHHDDAHQFRFDDGREQNIRIVDKENVAHNKLQVLTQFQQDGTQRNRYDVTILVNGLPMVQIELKKRGVAIREAFNQVQRYAKESFNAESSLFRYLQLFIISNGTDTRYFSNTVNRDKNSFDFTMHWARADNTLIKDLKDFTATFFQRNTLLQILLTYSVFDSTKTLLVMRPYQIAATERILWKIRCAHEAKLWSKPEGGGYIWHTTGSGKTLTSFKAAQLATQLPFIEKVFFVVDRRDLDYQTMKEYQRFSPDSVNGSESTEELKRNLEKKDQRIIVTTIQKLCNLLKSEKDLPIYAQEVVFIFDEAHRSQFGEGQKNLRKRFKRYYQFGFTGTPIFPENSPSAETTASVFGSELHAYVITDAIRDEKVLKFKVDYNNVRPRFKWIESEQDEEKLNAAETREAFLHPTRIKEITQYILHNYDIKTHRSPSAGTGFNAMFAVSSIEAAKLYYQEFKRQQEGKEQPLRIATIFSFAPNEEQQAVGEIADENFNPSAMGATAKEFLTAAIEDYNAAFQTSFGIENFQNYYRDLAKRVKSREVDLLIVVGMFLTGFDAPCLNTLFVDKNLRYHGLMQAFSRTNRIYDATKAFGNIVTFRDLEQHTIDAITLFGDKKTRNVVLEKSYREYLEGFTDILTGEAKRGYRAIVQDLKGIFPRPKEVEKEEEKKAFVKLFGDYLRIENILQNYDEFTYLKAFQQIDKRDPAAVEAFKEAHFLTDDDMATMQGLEVLPERELQDYRSVYNDIRDWRRALRAGEEKQEKAKVDWRDVVFEVELLKSQEITLEYILDLIFQYHKKRKDKEALVEEVRRMVRSSISNRAKERLIVDFIDVADFDTILDKEALITAFYAYAQEKKEEETVTLIREEGLNEDKARIFLTRSLKREYVKENGTEFLDILPRRSPLHPDYLPRNNRVYAKLVEFVERYKGLGGEL
ncbi:MAG: type I restriction endonuclease subunit R [Bacteroides sp.]